MVLDDIENDENVRSPEQRDKLHTWLKKTIMPLGAAGEKLDIIYIGTILHHDSVLNRTLDNPAWRSARFKAILKFPDNMALWDDDNMHGPIGLGVVKGENLLGLGDALDDDTP